MASLETLALSCPRLDLAIASSPKSSLSIRRQDLRLGLGLGFAPRFSSLRLSRHLLKLPAVMNPKVNGRRISVACEAQGTATEVPDVTKDAWQSRVIENTKPVIVEFWAPWCGPCRVIHPVIAKLAKSYEGKLECFKINTDDFPDLASQYGIRSIPTIMIFKNGEKKDVVIGSVPESTLVSCISKYLGR